VYRPRESITPQVARHFTALVEPPTVAVNVVDAAAFIVIDPGVTVTDTERVFEGRESFNGAAAARPAIHKHTHAGKMVFFFKDALSGDRLGDGAPTRPERGTHSYLRERFLMEEL
jgi:hypothetical protein